MVADRRPAGRVRRHRRLDRPRRQRVFGPITVPGYLWSIYAQSDGAAPLDRPDRRRPALGPAGGLGQRRRLLGRLLRLPRRVRRANGALLTRRPLALGGGSPLSLSWARRDVARNTVYAAVGVLGLADGFVVAFRPGGADRRRGRPRRSTRRRRRWRRRRRRRRPAGPSILAGPGAASTGYATPVMVTQRRRPAVVRQPRRRPARRRGQGQGTRRRAAVQDQAHRPRGVRAGRGAGEDAAGQVVRLLLLAAPRACRGRSRSEDDVRGSRDVQASRARMRPTASARTFADDRALLSTSSPTSSHAPKGPARSSCTSAPSPWRGRRATATGTRRTTVRARRRAGLDEAEVLVRSLTRWFQLINLAEDNERIRRLRERERRDAPAPRRGSLRDAVRRLRDDGVESEALRELLAQAEIRLVVTAHPTEARRRTTIEKLARVFGVLRDLDERPGIPVERRAPAARADDPGAVGIGRAARGRPRPSSTRCARASSGSSRRSRPRSPSVYRDLELALEEAFGGRRRSRCPRCSRSGPGSAAIATATRT